MIKEEIYYGIESDGHSGIYYKSEVTIQTSIRTNADTIFRKRLTLQIFNIGISNRRNIGMANISGVGISEEVDREIEIGECCNDDKNDEISIRYFETIAVKKILDDGEYTMHQKSIESKLKEK